MSKIDIPDPAQHYFVCGTEACGEMNNAGMNIRRTKTPRSAKQSLTVNADFILLKKNTLHLTRLINILPNQLY